MLLRVRRRRRVDGRSARRARGPGADASRSRPSIAAWRRRSRCRAPCGATIVATELVLRYVIRPPIVTPQTVRKSSASTSAEPSSPRVGASVTSRRASWLAHHRLERLGAAVRRGRGDRDRLELRRRRVPGRRRCSSPTPCSRLGGVYDDRVGRRSTTHRTARPRRRAPRRSRARRSRPSSTAGSQPSW